MIYVLVALVGLVGLAFVGLLVYRSLGNKRVQGRVDALIKPLLDRLRRNEPVTADEVREVAGQAFVRQDLYRALAALGRTELFPAEYLDLTAQGKAILTHWLLHPNEMAAEPVDMELLATVRRERHGQPADLLVFRYHMLPDHWAAKDGWMLGVAGPFVEGAEPYAKAATAFSRFDKQRDRPDIEALVDWYMKSVLSA